MSEFILTWPEKAFGAVVALFRPLQDIDVYVEDTDRNSVAFYTELIKAIAPPKVRVSRVFPMGGRSQVIGAAQRHDFAARCALFVVDGDLGWVRGDDSPENAGIVRVNAYCIENLLISESSIAQFVADHKICTQEQAFVHLAFSSWVVSAECLVPLFVAFAALNKLDPSETTVGHGLQCLLTNHGKVAQLDPAKVVSVLSQTESKVLSAQDGTSRLEAVKNRVQGLEVRLDAVSGKDFVLPLLDLHLRSICSSQQWSRAILRFQLARRADRERFVDIVQALERASRGLNYH